MSSTKNAFWIAASAIAISTAAPAFAQPDTIVVTARKTEETLLETPVAVSVVSGDFLDETGFNTVEDIVRFVPGFDLTPVNTTRATGAKIRGISTFSFSDGLESSVATIIDGVVLGREAQGFFDFFDVESIEIIKGPQGTLFGKNASAGVINIRTKDPEYEFGGGLDVSYGSFNEVKVRGTVTGPLIEDELAVRLSGTYNSHDGAFDNPIPGERDINDKNTFSLRGKLLWEPNERFSATLIGDYTEEENHCCLPTFRVAGDPNLVFAFAANPGVLQLQDALAAVGVVPGPGNRSVPVRYEDILQESSAWGAALNMEYDLGDNTTLTSITSYREWEIDEFNEADGVFNSNVNNRNGTISNTEQFSQEIRLNGSIGEKINYVGGLYYFHQDLFAQGLVSIELAAFGLFNVRTDSPRTVTNDSLAAFGEVTYDLTDRLSLIAGGRFTHEEIDATFERIATPINPLLPFGFQFGPNYVGAQQVEDDNLSGRFILRYFWDDNFMTYASWSRGYKGPGIDVAVSTDAAAAAMPGGLPVLAPEIPTLIEAGFKTVAFDNSLTANVTFFHQNIRNIQTITTDASGMTVNTGIDKVNSIGVEADVIYAPPAIEGLTFTGGFTFNEVDIVEFAANPLVEDTRFRDAPRYFYSLIGDYRKPVFGSDYEGFMRAEWSWQSSKNSSLEKLPDRFVDAYGLLNLRVGVNSPENRYGITFAVENVADKDYEHFIFGSSYGVVDGVTISQYLGRERTWSVTLRGSF